MKQFLLFCGSDFYPQGGMRDLEGQYDTAGDAHLALHEWVMRERARQGKGEFDFWETNWAHLLDTQTGTVTDYPTPLPPDA